MFFGNITTPANILANREKNMKNSKGFSLGLLVASWFLSASVDAQQQDVYCFEGTKFSPSFIALETAFDSNLHQWYKELFQLETIKEFTFPDGNTKGVLMKRDDFVVEVFNKKSLNESVQERGLGVLKFGFFTDANLQKLQTCLKTQKIKAKRIFKDKNLNASLLLIEDPEGNYFEVITKN